MLEPISGAGTIKHLPVGDRYDGVNMSTLMACCATLLMIVASQLLIQALENWASLADGHDVRYATGSNLHVMMICSRPSISSKRLMNAKTNTDHYAVCGCGAEPRIAASAQFFPISDALADVNAIMAPPISDLSAARGQHTGFEGIKGVEGTRFHQEIERLGQFIIDYVVSGELDRIYAT